MPNILLEAMAAGLPIACSNRGPMPEVLGTAGLYFNPENPAEIACAIRTVIDEQRQGALALPIRSNWRDRFIVFLKGSECAHIVHAEDVADAAIFFMNTHFEKTECYIVSCDHDARNTYAGLWSLYKKYSRRKFTGNRLVFHMPMIIPHMLRSLKRGKSNRGNIQYSSDKLLSEGFRFSLGIEGAVQRIASCRAKHI
jgi:glycosyltransferase involved in cell wall biosynthesis